MKMRKINLVLGLSLLALVVTLAHLQAGEDPYSLLIDNVVRLQRLFRYRLEEQGDSLVKFCYYEDGSTAVQVAKEVELIKEPPEAIDNYDIIGLRYHFPDGTTREIFFNQPEEKSKVNING